MAGRLSDEQRAELTFLVARFIGALKAKHLRFDPVVMVVAGLEKLIFLNPFLYPYERATTYSGDQIGLACCGSLPAALNVLGGLMVGAELAPRLGLRGLLWQAVSVRRHWLPRLRQLALAQPHLTNRYLNLLEFGSRLDPAGFAAFVDGLDDATRRDLEAVLGRMPPAGPVDGRSGAIAGPGSRRRPWSRRWCCCWRRPRSSASGRRPGRPRRRRRRRRPPRRP